MLMAKMLILANVREQAMSSAIGWFLPHSFTLHCVLPRESPPPPSPSVHKYDHLAEDTDTKFLVINQISVFKISSL